MCSVAYFIDAFLLCVWNHKIIRPVFCVLPLFGLPDSWKPISADTAVKNKVAFHTRQTKQSQLRSNARSAKTKYSTAEPNIRIGTFAQSDLFADVTCHLEMFSLFMQTFEARLAMRKFKPCDATWPKSFEGAKLQVGLCIESLADCCVCKSLWNCYAAVESLQKR